MSHYNSWPLGKLPKEWQRPEPDLILAQGYQWEDPRDIVEIFEAKLAEYAGSKYACVVDCCTNAIFLALKFRETQGLTGEVSIPKQTYVSVPMQIIHAGFEPRFDSREWAGAYKLEPLAIVDGAARFTRGMYTDPESLHTLSFQIKKRLPIGRGGAILTNDPAAYEWLKLASYDGRNLKTPYDSKEHVSAMGWHYYMTPEDAARGILLMDQLSDENPDTMDFTHYPDLSKMHIFSTLKKDFK